MPVVIAGLILIADHLDELSLGCRKLHCAIPQTALPLLQKGPLVQKQKADGRQPQNTQRDDDRRENSPSPHEKIIARQGP